MEDAVASQGVDAAGVVDSDFHPAAASFAQHIGLPGANHPNRTQHIPHIVSSPVREPIIERCRRAGKNDDGAGFAIPLFVVLLALTAAASLSLLVDGGRATTAQRNANSIAFQASRSAAQELDTGALRDGVIIVSPEADAAARRTAATLLGRVGLDGSVTSVDVDGRRITVTITATTNLTSSAALGRSSVTVQGVGSTRIAAGVVSEETPLP